MTAVINQETLRHTQTPINSVIDQVLPNLEYIKNVTSNIYSDSKVYIQIGAICHWTHSVSAVDVKKKKKHKITTKYGKASSSNEYGKHFKVHSTTFFSLKMKIHQNNPQV